MKELRISAVIPLPDNAFNQAEIMAALQPSVKALQDAIKAAAGVEVPVEGSIVSVRPAKPKPAPASVASVEPPVTDAHPAPHHRAA